MRLAHLLPVAAAMALTAAASAQTDDFESYVIAAGATEDLGTSTLDQYTVVNGQGPGLVADGCTYSVSQGHLWWNGAGWGAQGTKTLRSNDPAATLVVLYDHPTMVMDFSLSAAPGATFDGMIVVYDSSNRIANSLFVSVSSTPQSIFVPPNLNDYRRMEIWPFPGSLGLPILDDHRYFSNRPGFNLYKTGDCPGPVSLVTLHGTSSDRVAFFHGNLGIWTKPSGTCAGLTLDLAQPTLGAMRQSDASGSVQLAFPALAAWCGRMVQAVDVATCAVSNPIVL